MMEIDRGTHLDLDKLVFSPDKLYIARTPIDGVLIVKRPRSADDRGSFQEDFRMNDSRKALEKVYGEALQWQHSYSKKGVLRGMHAGRENKIIFPSIGKFFIALVDVRSNSKTFGHHLTFEVDATHPTSEPSLTYFLPAGVANGFMVLDPSPLDQALYYYTVTSEYNDRTSKGFKFNDPEIGIEWPEGYDIQTSEKDANEQPSFSEFVAAVDQEMYK